MGLGWQVSQTLSLLLYNYLATICFLISERSKIKKKKKKKVRNGEPHPLTQYIPLPSPSIPSSQSSTQVTVTGDIYCRRCLLILLHWAVICNSLCQLFWNWIRNQNPPIEQTLTNSFSHFFSGCGGSLPLLSPASVLPSSGYGCSDAVVVSSLLIVARCPASSSPPLCLSLKSQFKYSFVPRCKRGHSYSILIVLISPN